MTAQRIGDTARRFGACALSSLFNVRPIADRHIRREERIHALFQLYPRAGRTMTVRSSP
jgi:hypothetical protein